jgi:hypothetical protein
MADDDTLEEKMNRKYGLRSRQHDLRSGKPHDYSHLLAALLFWKDNYGVPEAVTIRMNEYISDLLSDEGPEDAVAPILGHPSVVSRAPTTVVSCLTGTVGLDTHGHLNVGCLTGTDGLKGMAATPGADHLFTVSEESGNTMTMPLLNFFTISPLRT